jgi:lipoxygenase
MNFVVLVADTGLEKKAIQGYAHKVSRIDDEVMYESSFSVPAGFGEVGAVLFENEHHEELYIKTIHLHFPDASVVTIPCDSWAHSKYVNPDKRIFFTNKACRSLYLIFHSNCLIT